MKKIILISLLITFLVISGCSKEQKISECIEACVCVGNYEQPDRDSADMKLACKIVCDNSQYNTGPLYEGFLDDLDTKLNKYKAKCESYTGKNEQTNLVEDKIAKAKEMCDIPCKSHNGVVAIRPHLSNENIVNCECNDGYTEYDIIVPIYE